MKGQNVKKYPQLDLDATIGLPVEGCGHKKMHAYRYEIIRLKCAEYPKFDLYMAVTGLLVQL